MSTYTKYKEYIDEFIMLMSLPTIETDKIKFGSFKEYWLENKELLS
jgi:hypothetical protein